MVNGGKIIDNINFIKFCVVLNDLFALFGSYRNIKFLETECLTKNYERRILLPHLIEPIQADWKRVCAHCELNQDKANKLKKFAYCKAVSHSLFKKENVN